MSSQHDSRFRVPLLSMRRPEPRRRAMRKTWFPAIAVIIVASAIFSGLTPRFASGKTLFWIESGSRIRQADTNGDHARTILALEFGGSAIAADEVHGKLYWVSDPSNPFVVQRVNYNGTDLENLVPTNGGLNSDTEFSSPISIALDVNGIGTGGIPKMYVGETDAFDFKRANLDGSNVETFIAGLGNDVFQLGVDLNLRDSMIYWSMCCADDAAPTGILHANLDGSNVETLGGVGRAEDLALDLIHDKIYWIANPGNQDAWSIWRSNLNGTDREEVVPNINAHSASIAIEDRFWLTQPEGSR